MDSSTSHNKNRFHPYSYPSPSSYSNITSKKLTNKERPSTSASHHTLSVNELKRRIRDVQRLLNHVDLPADARLIQERALKGYEVDLKMETERRSRSEMIKKYHFVRFLDRKTATKEYKRLLRKFEELTGHPYKPKENLVNLKPSEKEGGGASAARSKSSKNLIRQGDDATIARLERRIHEACINVNYTIYYPLTEKYISLYPHDKKDEGRKKRNKSVPSATARQRLDKSVGEDEDNEEVQDESEQNDSPGKKKEVDIPTDSRPPMYKIVEKCMNDRTLDLLREGKLNVGSDGIVRANTPSVEESGSSIMRNLPKVSTPKLTREGKQKHDSERARYHRSQFAITDKNAINDDKEEEEESDGGFFEK